MTKSFEPVSFSCALVRLRFSTRVVRYSIFRVMLLLNVMFSPMRGAKLSLMLTELMSYIDEG